MVSTAWNLRGGGPHAAPAAESSSAPLGEVLEWVGCVRARVCVHTCVCVCCVCTCLCVHLRMHVCALHAQRNAQGLTHLTSSFFSLRNVAFAEACVALGHICPLSGPLLRLPWAKVLAEGLSHTRVPPVSRWGASHSCIFTLQCMRVCVVAGCRLISYHFRRFVPHP